MDTTENMAIHIDAKFPLDPLSADGAAILWGQLPPGKPAAPVRKHSRLRGGDQSSEGGVR